MSQQPESSPAQPTPKDPQAAADQGEAIRDRIEATWLRGERPDLDAILAATPASERPAMLIQLIQQDLDYRYRAGESVLIETYFQRYPELAANAETALQLIAAEFRLRGRQEPRPTAADYQQRFPELAAQIEQALSLPSLPGGKPVGGPNSQAETVARTGANQKVQGPAEPVSTASPAGYEILGELGRGGMGVVYKARHLTLKRTVALKMVLTGSHAGAQELARFKSEAEAVARLQHPNIVQIFEVGEHNGLPFCALEYVEGGSLAHKVDGQPLPPSVAAGLVRTLAEAMHLAHSRNVIHRDLKPANVLLTADGVPKVTDFGLARQMDSDSGQTQTGAVMGTPSYMAPEQASGQTHAAGPAADVYALGAILYACLTGQPPFKGASPLETMDMVRSREPEPPSRRQPRVPRDLETICLKCLAKEPEKRYASALELAEDLRRFQNGEPIHARPVGRLERTWRWCRRNPSMAAMAAVVVLLGLGGLGGILWQWRQAEEARGEAVAKAAAEAEANRTAQAARRTTELTLADTYTSFGIMAGERDDPGQAVLWFAQAARQAGAEDVRAGLNRLQAVTWSRQAFQPVCALPHAAEWLQSLVFHPGGRYLLTQTAPEDEGAEQWTLWDLARETALPLPEPSGKVSNAAWNPDGSVLALGTTQGAVTLFGFPSGTRQQRIDFGGCIRALAFSADGHWLAAGGDSGARVWSCRNDTFATPELAHPRPVTGLAFNPAGTRLATGCPDDKVRVFAVPGASGQPLFPPVPHLGRKLRHFHGQVLHSAPLFLNDGRELLTHAGKGELSWRQADTGTEVRQLRFQGLLETKVISPDGRYLALSRQEAPAQIWDMAVGGETAPLSVLRHRDRTFMMSMAFSPDGQTLLTGCSDGAVGLWAVPGGKAIAAPLLHHTHVNVVAFAPDGRFVATAQRGGLVRLWTVPGPGLGGYQVAHGASASFAQVSPDGKYLLASGMSYHKGDLFTLRVHDSADGKPVGFPLTGDTLVIGAVFSPDGQSIAVARSHAREPQQRKGGAGVRGGQIECWSWQTGKRQGDGLPMPSEPRSLDYSPDGRSLAVLCAGGELLLLDAAAQRIKRQWQAHPAFWSANAWQRNGAVRFSPDGRGLLTWGTDVLVRGWEADTGQPRWARPLENKSICSDVQFAPDGRYLATAARDNTVRFWDWDTGQPAAQALPHPDWVHAVQFSPDGRHVLTGCRDGRARLWSWRNGQLIWGVGHEHEIHAVAFTPDGRWALTASDDKTLRVWDSATGKPLTPPLPLSGEGLSLAVTADGRRVVVGGFMKALEVFRLDELGADDRLDLEDLCLWGEVLSGQRVHSGGGTTMLTAAEWLDRWREYRRRHPQDRRP